jgi:hypothetical protein
MRMHTLRTYPYSLSRSLSSKVVMRSPCAMAAGGADVVGPAGASSSDEITGWREKGGEEGDGSLARSGSVWAGSRRRRGGDEEGGHDICSDEVGPTPAFNRLFRPARHMSAAH